jgi:hypothetical protein
MTETSKPTNSHVLWVSALGVLLGALLTAANHPTLSHGAWRWWLRDAAVLLVLCVVVLVIIG